MKIYYSGAKNKNDIQSKPQNSVGGYISCVTVPNDLENNIFPNESRNTISTGERIVIGLFLVNDDVNRNDISNLYIWLEGADASKVQVSIAPIEAGSKMERIVNNKALPYNANWVSATEEPNKYLLASNFPFGTLIGIWLKREISPNSNINCDELYQAFKDKTPEILKSDLVLKFEYDI